MDITHHASCANDIVFTCTRTVSSDRRKYNLLYYYIVYYFDRIMIYRMHTSCAYPQYDIMSSCAVPTTHLTVWH